MLVWVIFPIELEPPSPALLFFQRERNFTLFFHLLQRLPNNSSAASGIMNAWEKRWEVRKMQTALRKAWMLAGCAAVYVLFTSCGDRLFAVLESVI